MNDGRPFPPGGIVDVVNRHRLKIASLEAENQRLRDQIKGYDKFMARNNIHIKDAPDGQRYEESVQSGNIQTTLRMIGVLSPEISLPGAALSTPFEGQPGRTSLESLRYSPLHNRHPSSCGSDGNSSRVGVPQDGQQSVFAGELSMPVSNMGSRVPMPQNPAFAEPIEPSVQYFNSRHGQLNHSNAMGTSEIPLPRCL